MQILQYPFRDIGCLGISVVDVVSAVSGDCVIVWFSDDSICSSPDSDVIISSRVCFMMDSYTDGGY